MSATDSTTPPPASRVETLVIVLLSLAMVVMPILQAISRKLELGVSWANIYTQHAGVWLGFLGAAIATLSARHLSLATSHLLGQGRFARLALALSAVVSAVTCTVLALATIEYVRANAVGHEQLPGGVPTWVSEAFVPLCLGVIALRFIWLAPGKWPGRVGALLAVGVSLALFKYGGMKLLFWPGLATLLFAFAVGAPVFVTMAGLALLLFAAAPGGTIAAVPAETLRLVQNPMLPAIPLLTLAGYVLASGKASERMVRAYKSLFGWMPGGVALMTISVCAIFTTFTGGSGVTILALGGIVLPALLKDKFPEGFSLGLVTASGSLGLLFPPSLPVILYGSVAGVAADKLFVAGLVPGLLLLVVVGLYSIFIAIKSKAPRQTFAIKELLSAFWAAKWDLGLPIVIILPFQQGWAFLVEATAIGAFYALFVEVVILREVAPRKQLPGVMVSSATLVGSVIILMGVALGLTNYLVDQQFPEVLFEWVQKTFHSATTFLLALNVLLLVLGSVFEIYAAIIVLAPLIAPLGAIFNIDPIHLGVVFLANLELGFLFPPMGLNLFLAASRFNQPLPKLYRHAIPFLVILAIGVLVITDVPAITTGVVAKLYK